MACWTTNLFSSQNFKYKISWGTTASKAALEAQIKDTLTVTKNHFAEKDGEKLLKASWPKGNNDFLVYNDPDKEIIFACYEDEKNSSYVTKCHEKYEKDVESILVQCSRLKGLTYAFKIVYNEEPAWVGHMAKKR